MREIATHWLGRDPDLKDHNTRTTILAVGSDQAIIDEMMLSLDPSHFVLRTAANGLEARAALADRPVDVVVVDSILPDGDGLVLLGDLKMVHPALPIILVGSQRRAHDIVLGLRLGADDVVARPFDVAEFRARLDAILRRTGGGHSPPGTIGHTGLSEIGDLKVDHSNGVATLGDTVLNLTRTEFNILAALVGSPGQVLSRNDIVEMVWGGRATPESRALDVHIGRVRRKLRLVHRSAPTIVSMRLQAYRLASSENSPSLFDQTADAMLGGRSV